MKCHENYLRTIIAEDEEIAKFYNQITQFIKEKQKLQKYLSTYGFGNNNIKVTYYRVYLGNSSPYDTRNPLHLTAIMVGRNGQKYPSESEKIILFVSECNKLDKIYNELFRRLGEYRTAKKIVEYLKSIGFDTTFLEDPKSDLRKLDPYFKEDKDDIENL